MRQKIVFLSFLCLFCISCENPIPNPEIKDPIYSELIKESKNIDSELSAAIKELEGFEQDLSAVVPQTGKNKYAEKRVSETKARINKLSQMSLYWKLKIASRVTWDREQYLKAFYQKKPWPNPEEYLEYKAQASLERSPKEWSVKNRIEKAKVNRKPSANTQNENQ